MGKKSFLSLQVLLSSPYKDIYHTPITHYYGSPITPPIVHMASLCQDVP